MPDDPVQICLRNVLLHTPAGFAYFLSERRWIPARHLLYLSERLGALAAGKIHRLAVMCPPRHGKSELCSYWFPLFFLHHWPEKRIILTSYDAELASSFGRKVRNAAQEYADKLNFALAEDSKAANRWDTMFKMGRRAGGGMVSAGVGGAITGKGSDIFIIDDPIKNAEEAHSKTIRDKIWDWYISTAYTRLEPGAGMVVIMTRWHEEDLLGKILENASEPWEIVRFPAVAEEQDVLGRLPGDALWPTRYSAIDLKRIQTTTGSYFWSSMFQQRPHPPEGGMFPRAAAKIVDAMPVGLQLVRYWDKAGTEGGEGARTAGVLVGADGSGRFWILDSVTGRWSAAQREAVIKQQAQLDEQKYGRVQIWAEAEGGSGGKESAENTVRNLAGYDIHTEHPTGAKEVRAMPFAAQWEVGNVFLLRGAWNADYIDELASFPHGLKDQVDAASAAFNKLALGPQLPFAWLNAAAQEVPMQEAPVQEAPVNVAPNFVPVWPEDRWGGIM